MTAAGPRHLLVVDDDAAIRTALGDALREMGLSVSLAGDGTEALARLAAQPPDLVLTDVRMPELDGVALLKILRQRSPGTDVVLMTAYDDMNTIVTAMREGAVDFVVKPIKLDALRSLVERVLADRDARHAHSRGADTVSAWGLDTLIGRDARMIDVFKIVGQAAASRVNVLVRGESGTGKELVARAIHFNSDAAAEPFVPVNCTALPATLLESELFGHTRGAFTGAVGARRGRFALAGRGTIFLDEIGDTSLDFQSKLLRVLQEREFYALGADEPERTEARVIAATHRDLERFVVEGKFRQDLYYRLRIVEVTLPPLRERLDDLQALALHLVRRAATAAGHAEPVISEEAIRALLSHDWPGNVRELENTLTRGVVLSAGSVIRPEHLALAGLRSTTEEIPVMSLDDMERDHVRRVLALAGGTKARAADLLGISRPRLNRILKRHGLE